MDGKLEEAAKDAKKMIRLDGESVPGYLRAGKVLGLMGKWEAALGMYRYGLERVPAEDKDREVCVYTVRPVVSFMFGAIDTWFSCWAGS